MAPGESRQDGARQAGCIDLDHVFMQEEFVEAAAEMAPGLDHHNPRRRDIQPKRFKQHRIGFAAWLVWLRPAASPPLRLWGWQIAANAAWSSAFFGLRSTGLGLAVILVLVALIGLTIRAFHRRQPLAAWLMGPYLAWTLYATYLNAGFWWLNRG